MNKHIKLIVPFLVAFSAVTLAGCNNGGSTTTSAEPTPVEPGDKVQVDSISLNRLNIALALVKNTETGALEGEEFLLEASTLPRTPVKATIKYSSSDASVASVDKDGKIKALKAGECKIIAKSFNGKVEEVCNVYVYEELSKSAGNKQAKAIQSAQQESKLADNLDRIYVRERLSSYLLKNNVLQNLDEYDQYMYVGKSEAYMRLGAMGEKEIKVEGGSSSFTDWEWVFYTTENYDTYMFHKLGNSLTYMVCDTTAYVGQSRWAALCAILDSFFTSGSKIVSSQYDDIIGKDELGYASSGYSRGFNKDGEIFAKTKSEYKNQIADQEDEDDYYIPAGTSYDVAINIQTIFQDNAQYGKKLIQEMKYKIGSDNFNNVFDAEYEYHHKDIEFFYPDRNNYVKVDDIFSL